MRRGRGERCWGYVLADGTAAVCMRTYSDQELEGGWLHRLLEQSRQAGPAELVYDYCDAHGQLLHQTVRRFPKRFLQRRPEGHGGWIWNLRGVETVLYRLPELLAADPADPVFLVEGEKDVDRLRAGGLVATCNPMGAGKWRPEYGQSLRGRHVVIVPDNDAPGRAHADHVAHALRDQAARVDVVQLPGLREHGDVTDWLDWLDAGHDFGELQALVAASAPTPASTRSGFVFTRLADLLAEPIETTDFLVADLLPRGGVSMIAAKPKVGKSTTARNLAYAVATGTPFLGRDALSGPVLYLALEEKRAEVAAHFRRMGASNQAILIHVGAAPTSSVEGITALAAAIGDYQAVLAIADPALRLLRVRDSSDYAEMTTALEPVVELARGTGCHICIPHHAGKMERGGGDAVLGSTALFGSVDTLIEMRRREYGRTLLSIQRYGPDLDETVVQLDEQTGLIRLGGTIDDIKISQAGDGIKRVLADQDAEGLDESAIRERVEAATSIVARALRALVADHTVIRTGAGKKGDPYRYRLALASPSNGAEPLENARFLVPTIYAERENEHFEQASDEPADQDDDEELPW
jgi:hypothetical protein